MVVQKQSIHLHFNSPKILHLPLLTSYEFDLIDLTDLIPDQQHFKSVLIMTHMKGNGRQQTFGIALDKEH